MPAATPAGTVKLAVMLALAPPANDADHDGTIVNDVACDAVN